VTTGADVVGRVVAGAGCVDVGAAGRGAGGGCVLAGRCCACAESAMTPQIVNASEQTMVVEFFTLLS
jgi:hypothetical protein